MAQKRIFKSTLPFDLEELDDGDEPTLEDYEEVYFSGEDMDCISDLDDDYDFANEDFESLFSEFRQSNDSRNDGMEIRFDDDISKELAIWAVKFGETHMSLTALLNILRRYGHELPKQARTLLHTPRVPIKPRSCPPGESFYYGIEKNLIEHCEDTSCLRADEIVVDFFFDGASLSNSSKWNIWPLIGAVADKLNLRPFVVHCYAGYGHPEDIDNYLMEFYEEVNNLKEYGVLVSSKKLRKKFRVRCYISDAPARAFLTGTMSHSSYHGCPKCNQVCNRLDGRMLYQSVCSTLRTDESYRERRDILHHKTEFQNRYSLLEKLGVGMVSQVVFDPMHLIDLGATPQFLIAIVDNKCPNEKFSKQMKDALNARYLSFRNYVPSEFERKPRLTGISDPHRFKANEFRQILLYYVPVLLKDLVSPEMFAVVLKLHIAVRLLSDPDKYKGNINAARQLLTEYVAEFDGIFGIENFKFKTHCLLHIADYVEAFGPLYFFSSYKYENHLRILKNLLRKNNLALQQFYNRFEEISYVNQLQRSIFSIEDDNAFKFDDFILRPNCLRDGCCMIAPGMPVSITGLRKSGGTTFIRGKRFLQCENFYEIPLPSMEYTGTLLVGNLSQEEEEFPATSVLYKFFRLPFEEKFVLLPLLHTS